MNIDFAYYRSIFWRRFPYFIIVAALLSSAGLVVAMILPPEYEARATLLVEGAQIPERLAASTVRTSPTEQLRVIEQRLMTRANLVDIAERLNVYARAENEPVRASQIVDDMRARTRFNARAARAGRGGGDTTFMTISFLSENPSTAAEVTNEFVTLILQENVEMRTAVAGDTFDFFAQEVDRLGTELDAQAAKIVEFKGSAGRALPESQQFLADRQQFLQNRLAMIDQESEQLEDQRERIIALFDAGLGQEDERTQTPRQRALNAARDELDSALLVYSEANPRVRLLRARIAQLEEKVQEELTDLAQVEAEEEAEEFDPVKARVDAQVDELDTRNVALGEEAVRLRQEIDEIDALLAQIPANSLTLQTLERGLANIQNQYGAAVGRLSQAETGERIELLAKGQRISIIEQATPPSNPTTPNRPMIAGAGVGAGILAGLALIVLLELFNSAIRRPVEITEKLGITPIAVLPYMRTDAQVAWRRIIVLLIVCGLLLVVPTLIYLVHNHFVPLDGYANRILLRFGFTLPEFPS